MCLIGPNFHKIMSLLAYCINILSFLHLKIKSYINFCIRCLQSSFPLAFFEEQYSSQSFASYTIASFQFILLIITSRPQMELDCVLLGSGDCKRLACSSFYSFQLIMGQKAFYMSVLSLFFQIKKGIFIPHFCIFYVTANNFTIFTS